MKIQCQRNDVVAHLSGTDCQNVLYCMTLESPTHYRQGV